MGNTLFQSDGVLLRNQLNDALHQLNSATFHLREVQQEYRSRSIPSPDGGLAYRQALRAETDARREYMRVAMILHEFVMYGKLPCEGDPKMMVTNSGSG